MSHPARATLSSKIQSRAIRSGRRTALAPLIVPAEGSTTHAIDEHGDALCGYAGTLYLLTHSREGIIDRYACPDCTAEAPRGV